MSISNFDLKLDTCGLACPLPLLKTKQALSQLRPGQILWVISDQASLTVDIKTLLRQTQDQLLNEIQRDQQFNFFIAKQCL